MPKILLDDEKLSIATERGIQRYGQQEWDLRVDLAACYRLIAHFGMTDLISNHISASITGREGEFLINPFGMLYEEMCASCFLRVNGEGEILENPDPQFSINLAGYVIHSAVHAGRPDVRCVIHTHTAAGIAVSALKCGVLPVSQSSMRFADIAYHDFEGIAFEEGERERIVADLGKSDAMVLRNHGLLAVGPDIPQAFNTIYRLERVCQSQVMAMSCQSELVIPSPAIIHRTHQQYLDNRASLGGQMSTPLGVREWPAMLRLLDRVDSSFRL